MKKNSRVLKELLATASLCGTLFINSGVIGAEVETTGGHVNLNTGAGLIGNVFNDGDSIRIKENLEGIVPIILADKPNARIAEISTEVNTFIFGGMRVSENTYLGPINAVVEDDNDFGPLRFIRDGVTLTITGVGNQMFSEIDFHGKNSILKLEDNIVLSTPLKTTDNKKGILELGVNNTITNRIGEENTSLERIDIGAGVNRLQEVVYAENINLTNAASTLILEDDVIINGNVITTAGDGKAKLIFERDTTITGNIGAEGNALEEVVVNAVNLMEGNINAKTLNVANANTNATVEGTVTGGVSYTAAGALLINGKLIGNVDFNNQAGDFYLGDNATLTGGITNTGGIVGTLTFIGIGEVTEDIGTDDANKLESIQIAGDNTTQVTLRGNVIIRDLVFVQGVNTSGRVNIERGLTSGRVIFNDENNDGGTLVINAPSILGTVLNPANGNIIINADLTITDPNVGNMSSIQVANNKKYTIDLRNDNVDLLNNGAKIKFGGADSRLDLINTSAVDDRSVTFYDNLEMSEEDEYGIIKVRTETKTITITNNGGPYTIGRDNTHRLKNFIIEGTEYIVIDNIVFTKTLSMNSTSQVMFNHELDLGADGNIIFGADGELIVNGVVGSITTSKHGQGTLTVNSGNISGTIGNNKNSLKAINIGANHITVSSDVFAPVVLTDIASILTVAKNVTLKGVVTTKNDTHGVLILGQDTSVTKGIGANDASLEGVEIGKGASSLGGDVYVGTVVLTDKTSVLTLDHQGIIHGNVTTADNNNGKLIFAKDGAVNGAVGENWAALEKIVFNGLNTIKGTANSKTFTIADANAKVTIVDVMTGNLEYKAAGELTATEGINGNIDFKGIDGTFNLGNGGTIDGEIASTGGVGGILNFIGDGTVTKVIGADLDYLTEIIFNGVNNLQDDVNAETFTIANAAANVTVEGFMIGNLEYKAAGGLTASKGITGKIDFKGFDGHFVLGEDATITGQVLSTGAIGGTLVFIGNGNVTENIGLDDETKVATISIHGDNTKNVSIKGDVFVNNIDFINGGNLELAGNLTAHNVDFWLNGGALKFTGDDIYTFNAVIANGQTGVLNVLTTLTATDPTIGTLKTINIGKADTPQTVVIQVNDDNYNLLSTANSSISFGDTDSRLVLNAPVDQTIKFAGSLKGIAGGGGIVFLSGNGHNLIVDGDKGVTLGSKGNELGALNIKGNVTITNNLDVHNINKLNIQKGAVFTDQSLTSAKIANINIGQVIGGDKYAATYSLDAVNGDFELNTGGMIFVHEDSALDLKNSSNANDHTITLTGPLDSGQDQFGIIKLTTGNKNLTITNNGDANNTLGTKGHQLKELNFIGNGHGTINLQAGIHVENIMLDIHAITLGKVNANIYFVNDTEYTAIDDINGNIDFQGKAGIINIDDNVKIDGIVISTGDMNGTLNFEGAGEVTKLITNIKMLEAGAGNVSLTAGGNYSIDEIRGNGNNNLTFGPNSKLTGYINKTGGQNLNLVFINGGSISGSIGSNAAIGNITVQAGIVDFASSIKGANIIIANGATVQINDNITIIDIFGENDNDGTLKLNNPVPINITGTIGINHILNILEIANNNVTITGEVKAQNINFSNAGQAATLTLATASKVTNVTTAGNNIHTLAVTDFDTGNGAIGTEDHRLKIELTGNGLVTINTRNFHSSVTTANNGQGNVKLNIAGGIAYDLGNKVGSLASIQISEDSTIKGDVYSRVINVDAGKNLIFERANNNRNNKNLAVPNARVDRDLLPRSLQTFTYLTDIKAERFNFADATSSVEFKNAALVDVEITGGKSIKFNENVWLKQEIKNIERLEFASTKFAILEKNIKASTLIADRTNILLLNNVEINANLNARDAVLDLATYELKHTGNVTYNGTLNIITYFDTTVKSGGHILVGNGANVDMSALDNLVIKVKSRSDITKIAADSKHEVVQKEAGGNFTPVAQAKVTVDSSGEVNRLIRWTKSVSNENEVVLLLSQDAGNINNLQNPNNINIVPENQNNGGNQNNNVGPISRNSTNNTIIVPTFDPSPVVNDTNNSPIASKAVQQLVKYVTSLGNNSDADKVFNELGTMPSSPRVPDTLERLFGRIDTQEIGKGIGGFNSGEIEDVLTDISVNMDNFAFVEVTNRLDELGSVDKNENGNTLNGLNDPSAGLDNNNRRRRVNSDAAVAAGDEDDIGTGIWGIPFLGKATQKSHGGTSGYKSKSHGGIIGFDYRASDSVVLGAAYTRADSKLRHQNYKTGDKTKATSDIYSVYGLYNWLTNNFFAEFIGSYGKNRIKNFEGRNLATGNQTAISKFDNTSYSGELLGGYNYVLPNSNLTTITPMAGVRYSTFKNGSYSETGTTFQNLSVRRNSYNRFEGIVGLKGVTNFFVQDVKIRPELHGFINYNFNGKLPTVDARLDGINEPLATVRFKPARVNYNLGGSLSTKYNAIEFGIRYNLSLAKKYVANQGSLRIKINL